MVKKKPSNTGIGSKTNTNNVWSQISNQPINDDVWNAKVFILEPASNEYEIDYITKFENCIKNGSRSVVKCISKMDTIFMVHHMPGSDLSPENKLIVEEAATVMATEGEISTDILAMLIKLQIMNLKNEDIEIKRQQNKLIDGLRIESDVMMNAGEVKNTSKSLQKVKSESFKKDGKKKTHKTDSGHSAGSTAEKKYHTKLRMRGEEWRDRIYTEDYPLDGPQLYIIVTGFTDAKLGGKLIEISVPLIAIIQTKFCLDVEMIPQTSAAKKKNVEKIFEKTQNFWGEIQHYRIAPETSHLFVDIAFVIYPIPKRSITELKNSPESICNDISFLVYDIQDLTRQHGNYLDNIDIIEIDDMKFPDFQMELYRQVIEVLPNGTCFTSLILNGIITAISYVPEEVVKSSSSSKRSRPTSSHTKSTECATTPHTINKDEFPKAAYDKVKIAESGINEIFHTHNNKSEIFDSMHRNIGMGESYNPIVINHGNFIMFKTFHLDESISIEYITIEKLQNMPIFKLWDRHPISINEKAAKIHYHLNCLLKSFESDIRFHDLKRLLYILIFKNIFNYRSSLKHSEFDISKQTNREECKRVYFKRTLTAEPKKTLRINLTSMKSSSFINEVGTVNSNSSDSLLTLEEEFTIEKKVFDCPDISALLTFSELMKQPKSKHIIDKYNIFEKLNKSSLIQSIHKSFNEFNCVDYKYNEVTDNIFLMFYNSAKPTGLYIDEWQSSICTPVCLEDFFDYVFDEMYNWIKDEESKYDDIYNKNTSPTSHVDAISLSPSKYSCLECLDFEKDLIMKGSLKYDDMVKNMTDPKINTSERSTISAQKDQNNDVYDKNGYSKECFGEDIKLPKLFTGYNLGNRRIQFYGKDSSFYSLDGCVLSTKYVLNFPSNIEYLLAKVFIEKDEITFHRSLSSFVPTPPKSISIQTKNGIRMAITEHKYDKEIIVEPKIVEEENKNEKSIKSPDKKVDTVTKGKNKSKVVKSNSAILNIDPLSFYKTFVYFKCTISWPNGLILEGVHDEGSPNPLYFKQYYISKKPNDVCDELYRCMTKQGEVMIFKNTQMVEILRPDSSYFLYNNTEDCVEKKSFEEPKGKHKANKDKKGKDTGIGVTENNLKTFNNYEVKESNGFIYKCQDGIFENTGKILIRTATEYSVGEVYTRRTDNINILLNKEGIQTVTFPDKTKITTYFIIEDELLYPEWTDSELALFFPETQVSKSGKLDRHSSIKKPISEEEKFLSKCTCLPEEESYVLISIVYTMYHPNYATVIVDQSKDEMILKVPGDAVLEVAKNGHYSAEINKRCKLHFSPDHLDVTYEACSICKSYTQYKVDICNMHNQNLPFEDEFIRMSDSYGKIVGVNFDGVYTIRKNECPHGSTVQDLQELNKNVMQESLEEEIKCESSIGSHDKCRMIPEDKQRRFFVLNRDLQGEELIHTDTAKKFIQDCEVKKWSSINEYPCEDKNILSIVCPVDRNESEKWKMESEYPTKPKTLTFKDLQVSDGKGFYPWMRPYKHYCPSTSIDHSEPEVLKLPDAVVLRVLEPQWDNDVNPEKEGAKEAIEAILRYRELMKMQFDEVIYDPTDDSRTESEIQLEEKLKEIANNTIEKLIVEVEEHKEKTIPCYAKVKALRKKQAEEMEKAQRVAEECSVKDESILGEVHSVLSSVVSSTSTHSTTTEEVTLEQGSFEAETETKSSEVDTKPEPSSGLQRFLKRRAQITADENYIRALLREGYVPPYFQNIHGGTVWNDLREAAGDAVGVSEKTKDCICTNCENKFGCGEC